jgi:VanZ family protein
VPAGLTVRRFLPPLLLAAFILASAPFMGVLRDRLLEASPRAFAPLLGGAFALAALAAFLAAAARIRAHRLLRFAALAAALLLMAAQIAGCRTTQAEVDAVERIHLLEYGLLALLFYRAFFPLRDIPMLLLPVLAATLVGTIDEWVQWLVPVRTADVRDVGMNASAAGIGLLAALAVQPPGRIGWPGRPASWRLCAWLAAGTLMAFAGFYDAAHLGHEIRHPQAGRFRSYFDEPGLRAAARQRAEAWRRAPPTALHPLALEDYFLTEGGWHIAQRNAALQQDDFRGAWQENRILEEFYAPVLELRSFTTGHPFRLPPWELARIASHVPSGPAGSPGYHSPVLRDRIRLSPSPSLLWGLTLAAAGAALAAGELLYHRRPR